MKISSLQQLEKIVEDEREITKAEHQVNILEEKERKLRKEIQKRPSFFRRGGDIFLLRQELDKVYENHLQKSFSSSFSTFF